MSPKAVPTKRPLLSDQQRQAIHAGALRILDGIGIQVESDSLRRKLAEHRSVRVAGDRAHFEGDLIEGLLQRPEPRPWCPPTRDRITLSSGNGMFHLVDPDTDIIRPVTWNDAIEGTRLVDAMHDLDVHGDCPGTPQDIPPAMYTLAEYVIGALYGRGGGSFVSPCSFAAYEYLFRMHNVMGSEPSLPLYVLSPLRLSGESLELVMHFLPRLQRFSVSSMPMLGATAPIHIPSAFMQSLAESFGGLAVIKLLRPDAQVHFGFAAFPIDMKYGSMVYSSPEMNLCDMVRMEMAAFYGSNPYSGRFIRTMAKRPGVQAAAEKAGSAVAGAMAGARHFSGAGKLSLDEVFSPEMLVIDREIADYAERFAWGIDLSDEAFNTDAISEGIEAGSFLGLISTVSHFRETYWFPKLMERRMLGTWLAGDRRDMRDRARDEMRRRLASYDFSLDPERAGALRRLYREAAQVLVDGNGLPEGRQEP